MRKAILLGRAPARATTSPRGRERGNVLAYGVAWALVLVVALGLVLDLGCAFAVAIHQNSMVQISREETQSTGNGFLVKNEEDATAQLAGQIASSLRNQGFDGEISVEVYEAGPGERRGQRTLPSDKRLLVYKVTTNGSSPTWILRGAGMQSIPISTQGTWSLVLYSNSTAWRPESSKTSSVYKLYRVADGAPASPMTSQDLAASSMSDDFKAAVDAAFKSLT